MIVGSNLKNISAGVIFSRHSKNYREDIFRNFCSRYVGRFLVVNQSSCTVEIYVINADMLAYQSTSLIALDCILEEIRPVLGTEVSHIDIKRVPLLCFEIQCLSNFSTTGNRAESNRTGSRSIYINVDFLHRSNRCRSELYTDHTVAVEVVMQEVIFAYSLFGQCRIVPPAFVVGVQRSRSEFVSVAVEALDLCSRPCGYGCSGCRNNVVLLGSYSHGLAVG